MASETHHPSGRIIRACGNCRERKTRCDGNLPTCTACLTSIRPLPRPCQYENTQTEAQELERDIRRAEARIRELEGQRDPDTVRLAAPYSINTPSQNVLDSFDPNAPSLDASRVLIDAFLPNGQSYGFFLDISTFLAGVMHPFSPVHASGLLSVVHLLGFYFSKSSTALNDADSKENILLSRAVSATAQNRIHVVHSIQAEVLLSTYYFSSGRILEGQYHLNTAMSIAVGAGYHKMQPSSRDDERTHAFWTVYTLNNCWDVVLQSSSSVLFGLEGEDIETPWPGQFKDQNTQGSSVQRFLHQVDAARGYSDSAQTFFAKASVLFRLSAVIATRYTKRNELPQEEAARISAMFASHNTLVATFRSALPQLPPASHSMFGIALITLVLAHVSAIQLNAPLFGKDANYTRQSFEAAQACVEIFAQPDVGTYFRQSGNGARINPMWGCLWKNVGGVLRRNREAGEMYERVLRLMGECSGGSKLIRYQWGLAQQQS
ncbi:ectomycorrhiza-upregulated binuclear zinc transcription factor [Moniliophthora roreri MCA 2997]|uniref:Ectomycorrhiza-upregulated binuclear zinc transcription factor n=2 Tax=Moniliophthora roreri TaxID=221103 RepID=V2X9J4_MONRO|nr:ectomycorrhiza-upregulated binuclear zinc transcription factor [Moniliophthora roreri MCA 2997]KAI3600705.1 ectomycorrhiza-upregulated binuclear zinc transcription factor [Moniliophthora roreri]